MTTERSLPISDLLWHGGLLPSTSRIRHLSGYGRPWRWGSILMGCSWSRDAARGAHLMEVSHVV